MVVREVYFPQKGFHLSVERSSSDDDLDEVPSKYLHGLFAYLVLDFVAHDRDVQQKLAQLAVDLRKNVFLEDFFNDEGHAGDDAGTDDGKRFGDDFRAWHACKKPQVSSDGNAVKEVEYQSENMSQRKHRYDPVARLQPDFRVDVHDV